MKPRPLTLALACHPAVPSPAVGAVTVDLAWRADGGLGLRYRIHGPPAALRLPSSDAPVPADRLWAHTCCELFAAAAGEAAYREFNFSPSRQWAAYAFDDYRVRSADFTPPAPLIATALTPDGVILDAVLDAAALPASASGRLEIGLSVVVEASDGRLGYWALHHPGPRPDFHHHGAFALELALPHAAP